MPGMSRKEKLSLYTSTYCQPILSLLVVKKSTEKLSLLKLISKLDKATLD